MDIKKKNSKPSRKNISSDLSRGAKSTAVVIGAVWVFALLIVTLSLIYSVVYAHVSFPGATLSAKDVSNLSRQDVKEVVEKRVKAIDEQKWQLTYRDKKAETTAAELGLILDTSKTTEQIWNFGRTENFFVNMKDQFFGLFSDHNFSPIQNIHVSVLHDFVASKISDFEEKPKNATLSFNENAAIKFEGSNPGRVIDVALLVNDVKDQIASGASSDIQLVGYAKTPTITNDVARASRQKLADLVATPITLRYENETWSLNKEDISSWIQPIAAEVGSSTIAAAIVTLSENAAQLTIPDSPQTNLVLTQTPGEIENIIAMTAAQSEPLNIREFANRKFGLDTSILASNPSVLAITIDKAKMDTTFDPITFDIDVPGKNAKLAFEDGVIVVKEKSEDGRGVDRVDALGKILTAVNSNKERSVALAVDTIPAKVTEDNFKGLGIKELLATGESNFAGSPRNRVHNIRTAAAHFEGALIAPGEEYSFVGDLGEVDASTGYLEELVIKGNKITPEFGGGVCQVSSTMFRAAVYAGLNITERRNHAFVVSYYGTPGMDATIYIPHPDLRFVNDTPSYILVQPRIEGTRLYFDFFGTSDGRETETQGPYIYARQSNGALKATWTQIVKRDGEVIREKVFQSSYKSPAGFTHTN